MLSCFALACRGVASRIAPYITESGLISCQHVNGFTLIYTTMKTGRFKVVILVVVIHQFAIVVVTVPIAFIAATVEQLRVGVQMLVHRAEAYPLPVVVLLQIRLQGLW